MGQISLIKRDPEELPNSWANFKKHSAGLIREALLLLRTRDDLVKDEIGLNRVFYFCLLEASRRLTQADPTFNLPLPAYDGHNPPHPEDKRKTKREDNRPDFYWTLIDHGANYSDWYRTFVLECKRLGEPTSHNWELTKEYVKDGILRFFQEEKGYGKGSETGAMVGYVQNKTFDEVLDEVNSKIIAHERSIPLLVKPAGGWKHQDVSYLSHVFSRSYISLRFLLQHFWVDMRDCPYQDTTTDTRADIEQENMLPSKAQEKQKEKKRTRKKSEKVDKEPLQLTFSIEGTAPLMD